jgi:hypothetical protein
MITGMIENVSKVTSPLLQPRQEHHDQPDEKDRPASQGSRRNLDRLQFCARLPDQPKAGNDDQRAVTLLLGLPRPINQAFDGRRVGSQDGDNQQARPNHIIECIGFYRLKHLRVSHHHNRFK